ncbi:MAG TPA: triose-phosphate isomerase [Spirochaetia bacterium]|nr:triose-phosphate isomerase [Spirochaetia bacterium]
MGISYIAGNWKMHKTRAEAEDLASTLVRTLSGSQKKIMIAPPFTALESVARVLKGSNILLGSQNMCSEESGAHTGEISVLMLKDLGVRVVILGHSERRSIYGESDELINKKVHLAVKHGLEVILCVGETLEQRESGKAESTVQVQVERGLEGISEEMLKQITIAYEPVWAIGTGKNATPQDADAMHLFIRREIKRLYSDSAAKHILIQYGGSVKPENAKSLLTMPNINGALVGGASLKADTFVPIVEYERT